MRRYLRTTWRFWGASIAAEMEYRLNFAIAALGATIALGGGLFTLSLFYGHGNDLGGWTWPQAVVVLGVYTLLAGLQATIMTPNRMRVTEYVRDGGLDFVLLKPIDSQFWLSTHKLSLWGLPNVLMGFALIAWGMLHHEPTLSIVDLLRGLPLVLVGAVVLYSIGFFLCTLTIWFVKMWNITLAMQELVEAGRYPLPAYPLAYQAFFTFVLPVAFMTTVPAAAMTGRGDWRMALAGLGVAAAAFLAARAMWLFALRSYTSASS